jgi:hypothetical protein
MGDRNNYSQDFAAQLRLYGAIAPAGVTINFTAYNENGKL